MNRFTRKKFMCNLNCPKENANDILGDVWPEWQIVRGTFGVVYEAVRMDPFVESRAAIKVISLPQNESEIDSLRSERLPL